MRLSVLKCNKSKLSKDAQSLNNPDMLFTLFVSKLSIFNDLIELHPSNIFDISNTLEVLKFVKSNSFKEIQSLNKPDIFLTFFVFIFRKSILFSDSHPSNIWEISSTLLVSIPKI